MPEPRPVALQRAAALAVLPAMLADLGIGIDAVLAGTGVAPEQLRPDHFIPYAAFLAILENASRLSACADLAIRIGQRQTLAALGPLGEVMRHAPTLGEALADFVAFQGKNSTGGAVYLMRAEQDVILGYGVYDIADRPSWQIYDLVLAVGCNLIAELTGGAVGPEEMLLSRPAPQDTTPYQRLSRSPVRFAQDHTGLVLRASALAFPLPAASAPLRDQALTRLLSGLGGPAPLMAAQVRHQLRPLMLTGQSGMAAVSARLGLHPRALRRLLQAEGTTFEALKDEVRSAVARELLMLGDLSLAEIAFTLGYATPSAFIHAFRRWYGTPPGRWRAANTATASPR